MVAAWLKCFFPQAKRASAASRTYDAAGGTAADDSSNDQESVTPAPLHKATTQEALVTERVTPSFHFEAPSERMSLRPTPPAIPRFSLQEQLLELQLQIKEEQAQYPWNPHASRASLSVDTAESSISLKGLRTSMESHASNCSKLRKPSNRLSTDSRISDVTRMRQSRISSDMGSQRCGRPSTDSRCSETSEVKRAQVGSAKALASMAQNASGRPVSIPVSQSQAQARNALSLRFYAEVNLGCKTTSYSRAMSCFISCLFAPAHKNFSPASKDAPADPGDSTGGSSAAWPLPVEVAREDFPLAVVQDAKGPETDIPEARPSPSSTSTPRFSLQQQISALQQSMKQEQAKYPWNPNPTASTCSSMQRSKSCRASVDSPASRKQPRKASSRLSMESRLLDLAQVGQACDAKYRRSVQRCESAKQDGPAEMWEKPRPGSMHEVQQLPRGSSYTQQTGQAAGSDPSYTQQTGQAAGSDRFHTGQAAGSDRFHRHSMATQAHQQPGDASLNPQMHTGLCPRAPGTVRATVYMPPAHSKVQQC